MHVELGLRINVLYNFRDQRRPLSGLVTWFDLVYTVLLQL